MSFCKKCRIHWFNFPPSSAYHFTPSCRIHFLKKRDRKPPPWENVTVREVRFGSSCSCLLITNPLQHPIMSFCTEGLPGVAESVSILGFCLMDSATSISALRRMTGWKACCEKRKIHQTGLEPENSESIWFVNHFPKFCSWMWFSLYIEFFHEWNGLKTRQQHGHRK